ncbi:hypothetical protein PC116_g25392 [Phytophthora cactorum]|uniref:Uncharacterized protein n=1 Tax=Phytophthora cactorum TaxID=29920 RepID=A0A8T1B5A6_9STRA|nr:hypothetical protein Pcac1_g19944 [Phytophthora cactorum]KAG2877785.1 hypothetical protein PC114_g23464 [Phytophthora cactorum]KAG2895215.1 hypothetical protein PC117_g23298 [Phytophthora cactorum]KAG2966834.1 hypothetical protein PC119_g24639 [Phytophthora cactorum]KAG3130876.1 hypothetical protein C6341_g23571 [Phytophthora cactorum]
MHPELNEGILHDKQLLVMNGIVPFGNLELPGLERYDSFVSVCSNAQPIAKSQSSQMTLNGFVSSGSARTGAC